MSTLLTQIIEKLNRIIALNLFIPAVLIGFLCAALAGAGITDAVTAAPKPDTKNQLIKPVSISKDLSETSPWHEMTLDLTPQPRPDFVEAWGGKPVEITLPISRPALSNVLPQTTATLTEMAEREAGQRLSSEITIKLIKGDTLSKLLARGGASAQSRAFISEALSQQIDLRRLQIGTKFTLGFNDEKEVTAVHVHVPRLKQFFLSELEDAYLDIFALKSSSLKSWVSLRAFRPLQQEIVQSGNVIDFSLYKAASEVNIPPSTLDQFVRVMGFSVDFQRQIRPNDEFELIYEKTRDALTGDELSSGELIYAGIILSGKKIEFFRHEMANGKLGWFDRNGASAVRTLMRTPVNGARISSRFGVRKHPVTGFNAMHRGLDFAVPTGTPILAAGSGIVESAGWNGNYGRYVRIRHNSTYKTAYAHMSRFASKARVGRYVEQGEVIGFVGSSGRSTGPHLHYEILVNNRQLNPLTVQLPSADGLPDSERETFQSRIAFIERQTKKTRFRAYSSRSVAQASLDN